MRPKITVIGSLNMDLVVQSCRFPTSGETVLGESLKYLPGGKGANQAVAASRLGADVTLIGAVGDDIYGEKLIDMLKENKVNTARIKIVPGESSGVAIIFLDKEDNRITVIQGANAQCKKEDIDNNQDIISESDLVLIQLEIPLETVQHAVQLAKKYKKTVILNPAPARKLPDELLRQIDIITPNETELKVLTATNKVNTETLKYSIDRLLEHDVQHVVATMGEKGALYKAKHQEIKSYPGYHVNVVDTTGAGDSFNGGLAFALGSGLPISDALTFANKVAALSVGKFGAQSSMPHIDDVLKFEAIENI
ncbi:ribokinase [Bacillus sp. DTU_2020_1000418_1_SI_GHA_SEK_038]|uniref:ribokinase n=1 Tax=Bacillus sp. DTU_2020_1000418_1_SI_GHA_SEK_038 TaxID=3077585 RepID=UPI0028E8EF4A|nr:ribokinase [Bacillus sp. DTU_2020_1000418_1_SI_GHA_SEK_038]WNS73670.1 ribokinase [Bacillus sp. DTU_2020_1000418_1_SI_GHA_SEK_038]